jgi:hypothetical protein
LYGGYENMDNIYFYGKKSRKCSLNNCNGRLRPVQLMTKKNSKNATKNICLCLRRCNKCGCYYMSNSLYHIFKQYECANDFYIIDSDGQKEGNITTIKKRAGKQGYCIKCGAPEYREGIGYCWECYKDQRTGY